MARNAAGTYSLPAGNPVTAGTQIQSTWANTTMDDIEQAVTESLDRSGRGGMLASFRAFDGSSASPGISWTSETTTGWYYAGAGDVRFSLLGADLLRFNSSDVFIWDGSAWQSVTKAEDGIETDTISEATAAAGVTVDGVLLKDAGISVSGTITVGTITEYATDVGVSIESVVLKDGAITATGAIATSGNLQADAVVEDTAEAGVTIDGLLIKDSSIPEAAVTEHQAALSITESQVSDLGAYATSAELTAVDDAALQRTSDVTVDATTSRTLATTDEGDDIVFSSASAVTVTVPGTLAVGFQCSISQVGAGTVTLTSADNLNGAGSDVALPAQWTTVWLMQYSEGNWLVSGA